MRKLITYGVPIIINMASCTAIGYLPDDMWWKLILSISIPLACYCSGLFVMVRFNKDAKDAEDMYNKGF